MPARRCPAVLLTAVAALGASALAAPTAGADQLAFLRQGNIWVAAADGSGAHAITADGGVGGASKYTGISAAKGSGAGLLGFQQGSAIGVIRADGTGKAIVPGDRNPKQPGDVALNASGTRLAWVDWLAAPISTYWNSVRVADGGDERTAGDTGVVDPAFYDGDSMSLTSERASRGTQTPATQGCSDDTLNLAFESPVLDDGSPAPQRTWICVPGLDLYEPAVSPDLAHIVVAAYAKGAVVGPSRLLVLNRAGGVQQGTPVTPEGGTVDRPDWTSDSATIAYEGSGSTIWSVPAAGGTPVKLLDDADDPAFVPSAPSGGAGGGAGTGTGGGSDTGTDTPTPGDQRPQPAVTVTAPRGARIAALRKGLVVRGTATAPGTITATLTLDAKSARKLRLGRRAVVVARAKTTVATAGAYRLTFKATKKTLRGLGRARSVRLALSVRLGAGRTSTTLLLKR